MVAETSDDEKKGSSEASSSSDKDNNTSGKDSVVTVEAGNTYIHIVRDVVSKTSGAKNFSAAQKLAVETIVASQAGMPYVSEGEDVILPAEAVSEAVRQVKNMDDNQLALWEAYLPGSGL